MKHRYKALSTYESFTQSYKKNVDTPDALFRMIILAYEEETDRYLQRRREINNQNELENSSSILIDELVPEYVRVINYCTRLEKRFPRYEELDVILLIKGYCLTKMGRIQDGNRVFEVLVKLRPDSSYIVEAFVRIAEYYFHRKDYRRAAYFFKRVLPNKFESFYDKVLYRLGIIFFNQKKYSSSFEYFLDYMDLSSKRKNTGLNIDELVIDDVTQHLSKIFVPI